MFRKHGGNNFNDDGRESFDADAHPGDYNVAQGAYQTALTNLEKAKVNLVHTDVRSTVNGYVTNLELRILDYAYTGSLNIPVVDSDS